MEPDIRKACYRDIVKPVHTNSIHIECLAHFMN